MCNAEVAGIETRRSALNKLGQRQDYVADFAEKALNVDDFFALLSYKGQVGTHLFCLCKATHTFINFFGLYESALSPISPKDTSF
jgi:hypothetical protein